MDPTHQPPDVFTLSIPQWALLFALKRIALMRYPDGFYELTALNIAPQKSCWRRRCWQDGHVAVVHDKLLSRRLRADNL